MPDATITSTASTFGTISGTFAADQSTVTGTVTGIVAGTLTGSVGVPGPQGPTGSTGATGPAGSPGSPGQGVAAGGSTGQVLQKLSATSYDTGWLTLGTMAAQTASDYSTTAVANGLYYPLSGNPSGFLTASALTPYLEKAGGIITGNITSNNGASFISFDNVYKTAILNSASVQLNNAGPGGSTLTLEWDGITFASGKQTVHYPGAASLFTSPVLTGDPTAPTPATSDNDTSIATTAFVKAQGYLTSAPVTSVAGRTGAITLSNTDISGLGSLAVVNDAPSDGSQYARKNGAWDIVSAGSSYISSVSSPLSVTSGNLTVDLSAYAPLASPVFTGDARAVTAALGDNDTSIATTAFVQQELLSGTANARNLEVYVRNQTGSTIPAGSIVYINGATGNRPTITLAQANNDANSAQTFGFTKASIANNGFGFVIVRGELENIDTSALTEGVQLYLSPTTAGTWTTTKPSAPQHLVYVGIVVRAHPTQGVILVTVQNGYELPELHDVKITSPTNGQVLKYDSAQSLWVNGTDVGGVAWGGITGTLSSQTDLQSALDAKLAATTAATTYYPLVGNPSGFLTSAPVTSVAGRTGAITLANTDISGLGTMSTATAADYSTTAAANGLYYPLSSNPAGYIDAGYLTGYATESFVTSQGYLTQYNADFIYLKQSYNLSDLTDTSAARTNLGLGTMAVETASNYLTTATAASTYQTISGMSSYLTTANAASTYFTIANAANKADLASPTFSGTPSLPTGTIAVTQTAGNNTTAVATTAFVTAAVGAGGAVTSVAGRTGAVVLSNTDISGLGTMATATAADYSTTTVANGLYYPLAGNPSSFLVAADITGKANIASPSLTGTPLSTTAAADTNTTQIATTAYVVGQASSTTPANNGTAAVGTSLKYARADHVHATDTTRAPLASPTFTGTVTIPAGASISGFAPLASPTFNGTPSLPTGTTAVTQTAGDNTTAVATTAFVTTATSGLANNVKAWVNFNGTGTVAIRASMNVSSITDNGLGRYRINFSTAMSDANYAANLTGGGATDISGVGCSTFSGGYNTSYINVNCFVTATGAFYDPAVYNALITR